MAVKGNVAKDNVIQKLKEVYGNNFIGVIDKKVYIWEDDGGQKAQIAITMTCPKTNIEAQEPSEPVVFFEQPEVKMTEQEEETIQTLIQRLGL